MTSEEAAREALRLRQGSGARYDAPSAPASDLILARRGTAYFARALMNLADDDLDAPSRVPGWLRRHVIAQVGYQARALCRLAEGARTGVPQPMYVSAVARDAEIALGATLPARALRTLFDHSEVHLSVEWRDLGDADWDRPVTLFGGAVVPVRATVWLRAREVWLRTVDLASGGSARDFPSDLQERLKAEAGSFGLHSFSR